MDDRGNSSLSHFIDSEDKEELAVLGETHIPAHLLPPAQVMLSAGSTGELSAGGTPWVNLFFFWCHSW